MKNKAFWSLGLVFVMLMISHCVASAQPRGKKKVKASQAKLEKLNRSDRVNLFNKLHNSGKLKKLVKLGRPKKCRLDECWYECQSCGFIYDPVDGDRDQEVERGTAFRSLPSYWVCPVCEVGKDNFHLTTQ